MINYIFCKNNGYPLNVTNILQFILLKLLVKVKKTINNLPKKFIAIGGLFVKNKKATAI